MNEKDRNRPYNPQELREWLEEAAKSAIPADDRDCVTVYMTMENSLGVHETNMIAKWLGGEGEDIDAIDSLDPRLVGALYRWLKPKPRETWYDLAITGEYAREEAELLIKYLKEGGE